MWLLPASRTLSEVDYLALELLHHLPSEKANGAPR